MTTRSPNAVGFIADQSDAGEVLQTLPEPLPADPFPIFTAWFDEAKARRTQPNPDAMALATIEPDGRPSARIVLCRRIHPAKGAGCIAFFTNRQGGKGLALEANPRAAVVFHWDALDRQVRMEGPITRSPDAESDDYFATRPWLSRVAAWASEQSRPIASRAALIEKLDRTLARFNLTREGPAPSQAVSIPRPPHWGGYRLWPDRFELWVGSKYRLHDRAAWTRELISGEVDGAPGYTAPHPWTGSRLQP